MNRLPRCIACESGANGDHASALGGYANDFGITPTTVKRDPLIRICSPMMAGEAANLRRQ
jgi:hypothetical protein